MEFSDKNEAFQPNIETIYPLLPYEKQIFMDIFEKDALLIIAKGLNYNDIVANILWIYKNPINLVLVLNSNEHEEKYFNKKFNLTVLPTIGNEREKAYLEGGVYFVSTRILVVDMLKNRIPVSHITGIIVLRAHTVLESCQESFVLRLFRQKNKTGFIKAFSNSPVSFTFGYHQVEKVMRSLFVTELYLWPRFHGAVINSLKSRQAEVVEIFVSLTTNMSLIQSCILDIMNYTVKQLKSINRMLDMQEITTENCITKKFHKILQSQLDCVWHQLSTRTKEYIQDLKVLRTMIIEKAYLEGGVYFVSTRILVVDMLKNRIPVSHITGIIVLRAHTVLESCQESFVLRLFRQKNKTGFIKAFSNSPVSFTFGYHQVEKVMRSLFVTELYLWPRFHGAVINSLKSRQAEVVEIFVSLTTNMSLIQSCILDIMNYTVKQLKSINRMLDMQEITTENCITKKFHKILQSQLDCVWHQLSTRTKEYIQDLKVLRTMIINLIHDDAVSFYALVSKYRTPEYANINSGWILLDSAEQLFRLAKARVYNNKNEFNPESSPKWKCLTDLLIEEIPKEVKNNQNESLHNTKILILCQDNKSCCQLNHFLTMGENKYLLYTAFRKDLTITSMATKYKEISNKVPLKCENPLNIKNDTEIKNDMCEEANTDELNKSNYVLSLTQRATEINFDSKATNDSIFEPLSQVENLDLTQIETDKPIICIQTFKQNGNHFSLSQTLETLRPQYIVLHHSDVAAVRQIELFECKKKPEEPKLKVYFLIHDKTVEEQAYLTSLRREKQAFEQLIQTKSVMVIPSYQDGKTDEYFNLNVEDEENPTDTRKAGGQTQSTQEKPVVIVDMREFRSDLPALLHKNGINIEPVTIAIGDYVLTPDICVERKSLSDLVGSLSSGRLFAQATHMCRAYSRPVLLIEFDQNKPFHLQGNFVISSDISGADIQQKLQLLTIHFPRLKLVWSPSPYATAELFYELKQGRKNPIVEEALALSGENTADDINYERFNIQVHDFVQKLPGITSKNITRFMNRGISLDHVITLSQEQIAEIMENKNEAEILYSILHVKAKATETDKGKTFGKKKFIGKLRNVK